MKIVVFGAGGIVGQHMMQDKPYHIGATFCRTQETPVFRGVDLTDTEAVKALLGDKQPDVVINLAGENRVDVVEKNPAKFEAINVLAPEMLAEWCDQNGSHFIQVSTQGVFSGENPPYNPWDVPNPITAYGRQKAEAEYLVQPYHNRTIARLTFVLGVRPYGLGRENPVEAMMTSSEQLQVNDRWFSPCFAADAATQLWKLAGLKHKAIVHVGTPMRTNRYDIANAIVNSIEGMGHRIIGVSHSHFPGIAPRPKDTTWAEGSFHSMSFGDGIRDIVKRWSNGPRNKS